MVGAARRRRNRHLHAFLKHERMTLAMNLATIQHHSFMKSAVVDVGVPVGALLRFDCDLSSTEKSDGATGEASSVTEDMSPAPAVTDAPPDPVIEHLVPTPPVPVVEYVTPVPVPDFVTPPVCVISLAVEGRSDPKSFARTQPHHMKTLYTCPSLTSRCSLWVSKRSIRNVLLSGLKSRSCALLFLTVVRTFLFLRAAQCRRDDLEHELHVDQQHDTSDRKCNARTCCYLIQ